MAMRDVHAGVSLSGAKKVCARAREDVEFSRTGLVHLPCPVCKHGATTPLQSRLVQAKYLRTK
jgi:hypothetical protein